MTLLTSGPSGCASRGPGGVSPATGLPEYTPEESRIFDDVLAPTVFGHAAEPITDDGDMAQAVRLADFVGTVLVSTVTEEALAGTTAYVLVLRPSGPPLSGRAMGEPVELRIRPGDPAYARVGSAGRTLVGQKLILFSRRYAEGEEPRVRFHGEGDSPELRQAILRVKALDGAGGAAHTGR
jgi:hypothetical protein